MKPTGFKVVKMDKNLHRKLKIHALKIDMPLYQVIATACLDLLKREDDKTDKKK